MDNARNAVAAFSVSGSPIAPTNLVATAISSSQIDLQWQDNSNNKDRFRIERNRQGYIGWAQIGTITANVNTYSETTGLFSGTKYNYRVSSSKMSSESNIRSSAPTNIATATTLS